MTTQILKDAAAKAEAAAAAQRKPVGISPITDAVYPKKGAQVRKAKPSAPARARRGTTVAEIISPSSAAALSALHAELEAAQPKKKRRAA